MDVMQVVNTLPSLKDKVAVTLVSRLSGARDHIKVQKDREDFFSEVVDFIRGTGARRQHQINQHVVDVLETTVDQLVDVVNSVALGHRAIAAVGSEVKSLQSHTGVIAVEVISLRDKLYGLARSVDKRMGELELNLQKVDARTRAQEQLVRVFERWNAGLLDSLPLAARCYAVMEELWWGDFGHFLVHHPGVDANQLREDLRVKAMGTLAKAIGLSPRDRVARDIWLENSQPGLSAPVPSYLVSGMALLSDWAEPRRSPFVYSIAGGIAPDSDNFSSGFPFVMSSERIANALEREFFVSRESVCV